MSVIVGVPVTERGVSRLAKRIILLAARYGSIAIPLPEGLCSRIIMGSRDTIDYALNFMNPSQIRVWSSLFDALRNLVLEEPQVEVLCYASEESYKASEDIGYAIATLVVKARAFNKVDVEEWLDLFKSRGSRESLDKTARLLSRYEVVVADGYSWAYRLSRELPASRILAVDTLIPTPLDLLELIALNYVDRSYAGEVVAHAIRYVGEYILLSATLTEAYDKLLRDRGYLKLIERIGLNVWSENF